MSVTNHAPAGNEEDGHHLPRAGRLLTGTVWSLIFGALISLILIFELLPVRRVELEAGQVSSADIRAPRKIVYVSQVLTEQARRVAEQSVKDVYDPPDPKVGREQAARMRQILNAVETTRTNASLSERDKILSLMSISDLALSEESATTLLRLDDTGWLVVTTEAENVLNIVMRDPIRTSDLFGVRNGLPPLVRLTLSDSQTRAVIALVQNLIKVNSFYNAKATQQSKQQARDSVEPVTLTVEKGQAIVRQGDIVEPLDLEILNALGLLRPRIQAQDILGNIVLALLITALLGAYLTVYCRSYWDCRKNLLLVTTLFLASAIVARVMVPNHAVLPYLFPAAAVGLVIGTLLDTHLAVFMSVLLGLLVGAMGGGNLELTTYVIAGSVVAILAAQRVERVNVFVFAGMLATLANWATVLAFRLPGHQYDWVGLLTLLGAGLLNGGIAAMLALLGYFVLGGLMDIPTTLRLVDLARPTHPLMRQLLLKAPGTYHHSILVSNMAEEAAERIGADPLLARVGAYYHDIGKTLRPYFFVDNQMDGNNVHDRLDPETSAHIIVSHVKDGVDLARKYKLPARIVDFIAEHHGMTLATYFYQRAQQGAGESSAAPDPSRFQYPGPRPRSKETAIVMLADTCEATVRSLRPANAEETGKLVRQIIDERLGTGELKESDLTLRDLEQIRQSFTTTLQAVFHPRIRYPGQEQQGKEAEKNGG